MPRDPRSLRLGENRPTAHGARACWRTWRDYLRGQSATRSTPRRWPRLFLVDTSPGRRRRLRNLMVTVVDSHAARPAVASSRGEPADGPRSTRLLADLAWFSSRSKRDAYLSRCWPRLFFADTSPVRRRRLRNVVATAFDSREAQSARASPNAHGEPANRPRSTCALADLA